MKNSFENPSGSADKKRDTVVNRIVVNNPAKEEEVMRDLARRFTEQDFYYAEREKTENESQIIAYLSAHIPDFIAQYGGTPIDFKPENIRVFDPKKLKHHDWQNFRESKEKLRAYYHVRLQGVAMLMIRQ